MKGVKIEFRDAQPGQVLVASAYLVFIEGPLKGLQLKCAVWQDEAGDNWVTGPRTKMDNGKYHDLLQEHESAKPGTRKKLYDAILTAYRKANV